jgi:hypothetical protein
MNDPTSLTTVDEAVAFLLRTLSAEAQFSVLELREADLISLHHGLGTYVRNAMGLWGSNQALLQSCQKVRGQQMRQWLGQQSDNIKAAFRRLRDGLHPDDASSVIIQALWRRLQSDFRDPARREHLKDEVQRIRSQRPWWYDNTVTGGRNPDLEATITFRTVEYGGRPTPVVNGYMGLHVFEGDDCRHRAWHWYRGCSEARPGDTVSVAMGMLHPEKLQGMLRVNQPFTVAEATAREGERVVGQGVITQIINSKLAETV